MRIAHTVEFYWPKIGGAESVIQRVSEALARRGHDVTVLTSACDIRPPEEFYNGVLIRRFDIRGNAARGIRGNTERFVRELVGGAHDVVLNYACQAWPTDLTFRCLDPIRGVKVVAPCGYSARQRGALGRFPYRSYFRSLPAILGRYDAVVYHSASYLDYRLGQRWGLANGRVIPNGVDLQEFPSSDGRPRARRVTAVGNHYRAKNHADFMRLAAQLRSEGDFCLVAVPERQRRGCFDDCVRWARRTHVRLADGRDRGTVTATILESRVLVITSTVECAPLVALEAMAAGTPFVSYDVGCVRDYPGGLVVEDFEGLRVAVHTLLEDDELWAKLSTLGRGFVATLDWERVCDRYEQLYGELISCRSEERLGT